MYFLGRQGEKPTFSLSLNKPIVGDYHPSCPFYFLRITSLQKSVPIFHRLALLGEIRRVKSPLYDTKIWKFVQQGCCAAVSITHDIRPFLIKQKIFSLVFVIINLIFFISFYSILIFFIHFYQRVWPNNFLSFVLYKKNVKVTLWFPIGFHWICIWLFLYNL